jgi:hypothetical protein
VAEAGDDVRPEEELTIGRDVCEDSDVLPLTLVDRVEDRSDTTDVGGTDADLVVDQSVVQEEGLD